MTDHNFKFGQWSATDSSMKNAVRYCICKKCMTEEQSKRQKQILPMSKNILDEIKRQNLTKEKILEWLSLNNLDTKAIIGIYEIVNNCLNYIDPLDDTLLKNIRDKIISIGIDNNLDEKNIQCLSLYLQKRIERKKISEQLEMAFDEFMQILYEETMKIIIEIKDSTTPIDQPTIVPRTA